MRGATGICVASRRKGVISTHAPLAGRDDSSKPVSFSCRISTHAPLAGRDTCSQQLLTHPCEFQPTRPLRGATVYVTDEVIDLIISTHAPLAGRDFKVSSRCCNIMKFQPTRPLRGATYLFNRWRNILRFQPTRPLRGATGEVPEPFPAIKDFNPRAPCGARLICKRDICRDGIISTHAPLAGRDCNPLAAWKTID